MRLSIRTAKVLRIYVITADTHGAAAQRCAGLPLEIKASEARKLSDAADPAISVLLSHAGVVVTSIHNALNQLIKTDRVRATLRI